MEANKIRTQLSSQKIRRISGEPLRGDQEFLPISVRAFLPGRLTFTVYLKTIEGRELKVNYLPYCEEEEIFQEIWLTNLQERGITQLYFRQEDLEKVIAHFNNILLLLENEPPEGARKKMMIFCEHVNLTIRRGMVLPVSGPHLKQADWHVDWLIKQLEKGLLPYHNLWETLFNDYSIYNHAINVFLVSTAFMVFLGKKISACRALGIAALFHDIGLLKIPSTILYKPSPLTPEECRQVEKHPEIAVDMLQECAEVSPESLRLIWEHHENADGSGYPQGLGIIEQHECTPLLRLIDAYDALICQRPYRPAQSPFQALKILQQQWGPHGPIYHPPLLKRFIKFLGL
jgi:hypothetical protein